jgi:hypothetical protein
MICPVMFFGIIIIFSLIIIIIIIIIAEASMAEEGTAISARLR